MRVLYKFHVESFVRINDSSIAVGRCWHLLITHDRGESWEPIGELPEHSIIKQILWLDSNDVVINASTTGYGKIFYSCDGGRSFECTLKNTASSNGIVWDTGSNLLYAVDNLNLFYVSHDRGRTWLIRGSRIPYLRRPHVSHFCSLASFTAAAERVFYVTTSYPGEIFRTLDTGRIWKRVFSDSVFRNREIPMLGKLSDGRFFAVSAEGIIDAPGSSLLGSRSGTHWKILPAPEGMWDFGELYSRPGFIVAGGFSLGKNAGDAALFLSNNYGQTWRSKQVLNAALVWQIKCFEPGMWLLATDHGLLELNNASLN